MDISPPLPPAPAQPSLVVLVPPMWEKEASIFALQGEHSNLFRILGGFHGLVTQQFTKLRNYRYS